MSSQNHLSQTDTRTSIFICVLADNEGRYEYFFRAGFQIILQWVEHCVTGGTVVWVMRWQCQCVFVVDTNHSEEITAVVPRPFLACDPYFDIFLKLQRLWWLAHHLSTLAGSVLMYLQMFHKITGILKNTNFTKNKYWKLLMLLKQLK